jgi:hypothetical protein
MTKQNVVPATALAIATDKQAILTNYVNSFVSELTAAQQSQVRDAVQRILNAQRAIAASRLEVGKCLAELHHSLGQADFDKFIKAVGTKMGLSRSTAYRYYSGYKLINAELGPVAGDVMALTDGGSSITTSNQKTGAIQLTPEAKAAIAKMPSLGISPTPEHREQWVRSFVHEVAKNGRGGKQRKSDFEVTESMSDRIWEQFNNLAARINKLPAKERRAALDSLRGVLEDMVTEHAKLVKTVQAIPVATEAADKPKGKQKKVETAPVVAA